MYEFAYFSFMRLLDYILGGDDVEFIEIFPPSEIAGQRGAMHYGVIPEENTMAIVGSGKIPGNRGYARFHQLGGVRFLFNQGQRFMPRFN